MNDPKSVVKAGYDKVSLAYREDDPDPTSESYRKYESWVKELSPKLKPGGEVLDLGCGCGVPVTKMLSERFQVTGVDISPVQIQRARELAPKATFVCDDMCNLEFKQGQFDAIVSLYAIIHVPLKEQSPLLKTISRWLKPNGHFLLCAGSRHWTGEEADWLGVAGGRMYWSHADRDTYIKWLKEAGFRIVWDRFVPEGKGGHTLVLARKA